MALRPVLVLPLFLLAAGTFAQTSLRIGGTDAPPYRVYSGPHPTGIYVEVMDLVLRDLGMTATYEPMPMARALKEMEAGTIDLMLGPTRSPEREAFMVFLAEAPLPREPKVFFLAPGQPDAVTYEDLAGRLVGVLKGAAYQARFDADPALTKYEVDSYASGLEMVARSRIDALVVPELQGDYLAKAQGLVLRKATLRFEGTDSYVALSKKSPALTLRGPIAASLRRIRDDGRLAAILKRWGR
jgi:polar amino acid transport system substrate-binding protein